mgnify:FL=1
MSLHETNCAQHFVSLDDFERSTFRKKKRKKETGNGVRAGARIHFTEKNTLGLGETENKF